MIESRIDRSTDDSTVEALEGRLLMSASLTISPGYQDDTQSIQNALNTAGGGGTVTLSPGQYHVSSQLTVPSGVTFEGNGKATLNWTGGTGFLLWSPWTSNGTKVDGITLNGAGYKIEPQGTNLTVSHNTFENISNGDPYADSGIYMPDSDSNSTITGNTFYNIEGLGIYYFDSINVQITDNTFNQLGEGIKGQWFNNGSNDVIANNTLTEIYRFGIECQGGPVNFTVSGNTLGNWQYRDSHIGLSIATGEGNGINITNNTILGTGINNPDTAYTAIEAMGDNLTISGNFATGWGWAELVGETDHWVSMNNTWGVSETAWVTEFEGVNPSVDTNNRLVSLNQAPDVAIPTYVPAPSTSTSSTSSGHTSSTTTSSTSSSQPTSSTQSTSSSSSAASTHSTSSTATSTTATTSSATTTTSTTATTSSTPPVTSTKPVKSTTTASTTPTVTTKPTASTTPTVTKKAIVIFGPAVPANFSAAPVVAAAPPAASIPLITYQWTPSSVTTPVAVASVVPVATKAKVAHPSRKHRKS